MRGGDALAMSPRRLIASARHSYPSKDSSMRKRQPPILGVLRLDYDYPPALGDVDDPDTFEYDVLYRVIPGLTFSMCQSGLITDGVKDQCIDAVRFLDSFKVSGITGDCGFMIRIQDTIRRHTQTPVFLSSLIQLPTIVHSINPEAEIGVFTANSENLEAIELELDSLSGLRDHSHRLRVIGCQSIPGFDAVLEGRKVDTQKVGDGLIELTKRVLRSNPKIGCLLLECTELPPYANALRAVTGLPVYDSITNCNAFMRGFMDNKNFGTHGWQQAWTGVHDQYEFGENLTDSERRMLVTRKDK